MVNKKTNLQKLTDIQEETIAVTDRSEAEKWVSETILNPAQIKTKPTLWLAFKEGASKNVDVVVGDTASLTYFLKEYPDDSLVLFSENTLPVERFAFMLRKGQPELLRKLNAGLTQLQNEGTVDKLRKQWFEEIKKVEAVPTETTPKTASEPFY